MEPKERGHVALDELRLRAAVHHGVFIAVPHAGAQLVGVSDFTEHFADGGILGKWLKASDVQRTDAVCSVAVFHSDLISLDQQLCHIAAGIISVCAREFDMISERSVQRLLNSMTDVHFTGGGGRGHWVIDDV